MFHLRWFVLCQSVVHIETIELDLFKSKWPVDKNPVERWNKINELDQKNCGSRKGLFEEKLAKRFNAWRRKKKVGKKIVNEFGWKILKKKIVQQKFVLPKKILLKSILDLSPNYFLPKFNKKFWQKQKKPLFQILEANFFEFFSSSIFKQNYCYPKRELPKK